MLSGFVRGTINRGGAIDSPAVPLESLKESHRIIELVYLNSQSLAYISKMEAGLKHVKFPLQALNEEEKKDRHEAYHIISLTLQGLLGHRP